jgi:protein-disulfide isomerase
MTGYPMRFFLSAFLFLMASFSFTPMPAHAQAQVFNEVQRNAIRQMIRDYLVQNPEVLQEAMVELEKRQKEQERLARLKIIQEKDGALFSTRSAAVYGNPQGDVTLVEFFDYNCGFCKRSHADLSKLIGEDRNLRVISRDFPVLGPGSVEAATVAIALMEQFKSDKMWQFHSRLLTARGNVRQKEALDAARELGADMNRLRADMEKAPVRSTIEENIGLADALGLTGTPSYVLGDEIVVGAVGIEELKGRIANVRKCGKAAC